MRMAHIRASDVFGGQSVPSWRAFSMASNTTCRTHVPFGRPAASTVIAAVSCGVNLAPMTLSLSSCGDFLAGMTPPPNPEYPI